MVKTDNQVDYEIATEFVARWCPIVHTVIWLLVRESKSSPWHLKYLRPDEVTEEFLEAVTDGKRAH